MSKGHARALGLLIRGSNIDRSITFLIWDFALALFPSRKWRRLLFMLCHVVAPRPKKATTYTDKDVRVSWPTCMSLGRAWHHLCVGRLHRSGAIPSHITKEPKTSFLAVPTLPLFVTSLSRRDIHHHRAPPAPTASNFIQCLRGRGRGVMICFFFGFKPICL